MAKTVGIERDPRVLEILASCGAPVDVNARFVDLYYAQIANAQARGVTFKMIAEEVAAKIPEWAGLTHGRVKSAYLARRDGATAKRMPVDKPYRPRRSRNAGGAVRPSTGEPADEVIPKLGAHKTGPASEVACDVEPSPRQDRPRTQGAVHEVPPGATSNTPRRTPESNTQRSIKFNSAADSAKHRDQLKALRYRFSGEPARLWLPDRDSPDLPQALVDEILAAGGQVEPM